MNPQTLLNECRSAGVIVRLDGESIKLRGDPDAVAHAVKRLRPHKRNVMRYMLAQFRFDHICNDDDHAEVTCVNNMAGEFMQADGLTSSAAIKLAAEIVATCNSASCEAAYADVRALKPSCLRSASPDYLKKVVEIIRPEGKGPVFFN